MSNIEEVLNEIRAIQCPTGELEGRITDILEDYDISPRSETFVRRDESLDREGMKGYSIAISDKLDPAISFLTKTGMDDYVVEVNDVFFD